MRRIIYLTGLLDKAQKGQLCLFALLCLISPAINLFSISMLMPVFKQALAENVSIQLLVQVVGLSFILLLAGVFELLKNKTAVSLVTDISQRWSVKIYELYFMEDLEEHNQKTMMQAINAVRSDTASCASILTTFIGLSADILTLLAYFMVLIYTARWIGMGSCLIIAVIILLLYWCKRVSITQYGEKKRRLEIQAWGLVSTAYGSYKELKIDARKSNMLEKYRGASLDCAQVQKDYVVVTELQGIVLQNVIQSGAFLILAIVLAAGIDLTHILPEAVVFLTLLIRMVPQTKKIVLSLTNIQYSEKYYSAFQEDMGRYERLKAQEAERDKLRKKEISLSKGIFVRNLSFCYPNGRQIFEDASVDIPAGSSVAVIGPSGEGKTTFLDLLLGLLHPQSGHIWYDDYDIVERQDGDGPCQANIGQVVSYIPQIVYLDNETIRDNVVFMAEKDEDKDEEKIIECLKYAQMWEDVQKMPDGLDTLIGQSGTIVSGGQRQRIALARALYKEFEILVMDEATAALDIETERAVIDSIRQIKGNKTLLMVTHHPSLANECEHIYELRNRKLVKIR